MAKTTKKPKKAAKNQTLSFNFGANVKKRKSSGIRYGKNGQAYGS